jgi:hypothetical protein
MDTISFADSRKQYFNFVYTVARILLVAKCHSGKLGTLTGDLLRQAKVKNC